MAYELKFIMDCPGCPCKIEIYNNLDDCVNRMKVLINLPIKWCDFRIHEVAYRANFWVWKTSYLIKLYERRQATCGS